MLLVPGFFGFGRFGDLSYFSGVREALTRHFDKLGLRATIVEVTTLPTASIRQRAARVVEKLAEIAATSDGPIHIIGHSTGGLDARLALAPTASLPTEQRFTAHDRVHTLVTVCCPHFGTPAATYFIGPWGRRALRLVTRYFLWLLSRGLLLKLTLRLGYFVILLRRPFSKSRGTFDELYARLLGNFSEERRLELVQFLEGVSSDQSLLFQLTPAGCDLLNACTADPALRYGSVVARAQRPTFRNLLRSVRDLYTQLMYPACAWLQRLVARGESRLIPPPVEAQRPALLRAYGELPEPEDNDGLVPTNSQIWGEVVHATTADHLDVVGQYGPGSEIGGADWIPSYSGFDHERFEALWADVARFISAEAKQEKRVPAETNVGRVRTEHDLP